MIVVSNTTPLIGLAIIERFDLLQHLFGKLYIPQAVYDEAVTAGREKGGAKMEVSSADWIEDESHKRFGCACIRKLVMNNHQIRIIKVVKNLGGYDTFFFNKLGTFIEQRLPYSKIFYFTPNKHTNCLFLSPYDLYCYQNLADLNIPHQRSQIVATWHLIVTTLTVALSDFALFPNLAIWQV